MAKLKELQSLVTFKGRVDASLGNAFKLAQSTVSKAKEELSKASGFTSKISSSAGKLVKSKFIKDSIKAACDLNTSQGVVNATFGASAKDINKWAQTALKSFGLSELQAKKFSGSFGSVIKKSGITGQSVVEMSEKLTGLSGDFASFYNLSPEEAFGKIKSAISGDTGPLSQLGINMTDANLQAYALSKGINTSYKSMDDASKMALRYNYLMQVSKNAQGNFLKTQNSYTGQMTLLKANIQDFSSKVGQMLLPFLMKLAQIANQLISQICNSPQIMQSIQNALSGLAGIIGKVAKAAMDIFIFIGSNWPVMEPIIWGIVGAISALMIIDKIIKIVNMVSSAMKFLTGPIGWVVLAIGALVTVGTFLYENWSKIAQWFTGLWQGFLGVINGVAGFFAGIWNSVASGFMIAWQGIADFFTGLWNTVIGILKSAVNVMISIINGVIDGINLIPGTIGDIIGVNLRIPNIPFLAKGGLATQPSICGEAGPEMAIPVKYKNPRSLSLLNQTAKAIGAEPSTNGSTFQITYSPVIYGANKSDIQSTLDNDKARFAAWFEELLEEKARVSFG